MASMLNSGFNFEPPPGGSERYEDVPSNNRLTFKDFFPDITDPGGIFTRATYGNFSTLISRANDWLRANRGWKIFTCESVEFKAKDYSHTDYNKMTYLEYNERMTSYVRGLRLWLTETNGESEREQQIGYMNLIPEQLEKGGIFSSSTFETLDALIQRFNSMSHSNPLPGRVITIESQEMKMSSFSRFDPDRSNWSERGDVLKRFIFILRIFYEIMTDCHEEIGIKDFVPDSISSGGIFTVPKYEPFSNVVNKASAWCSQQQELRFCNAQSLEIKLKRGNELNTQKMHYYESGNITTYYVRILRVAYTKPLANQYSLPEKPSAIRELTCRTFVPVQLTTGLFVPDYENLSETKERVTAWVRATGAHVISAETAALRIMSGGERKRGAEASFTYNRPDWNEYWIFVIRLYLNGVYREPPPEMLPPVPDLEKRSCAIL